MLGAFIVGLSGRAVAEPLADCVLVTTTVSETRTCEFTAASDLVDVVWQGATPLGGGYQVFVYRPDGSIRSGIGGGGGTPLPRYGTVPSQPGDRVWVWLSDGAVAVRSR